MIEVFCGCISLTWFVLRVTGSPEKGWMVTELPLFDFIVPTMVRPSTVVRWLGNITLTDIRTWIDNVRKQVIQVSSVITGKVRADISSFTEKLVAGCTFGNEYLAAADKIPASCFHEIRNTRNRGIFFQETWQALLTRAITCQSFFQSRHH